MKSYVKEMRKHIGHAALMLCGASVIVLDERRRVLMLQRTDNGCWCFPGGALELGETTETTARREMAEETGLVAQSLELFGVFSGEELHYVYPHGDEVYVVDVVYLSDRWEGEPKLDGESSKFAFFDIDRLPEPISPPVVPVVREMVRRMGAVT